MTVQAAGVSFLVCTYNGAPRIAETLACLARQENPASVAWEVILVDNASTDDTLELARQLWETLGAPAPLRLLREPRPGKQFALDMAIDEVQYRFTCIVDDDNRLAPDYLRVGVELLESTPQIGILGGPSTGTFEGQQPTWFPMFQQCYAVGPQIDYVSGQFIPLTDGNVGRNVLWGAGMFVRNAVWQRLREAGFQSLFSGRQGEANLTAGEDDELCYAAQLLGYEVWYSSRLHLHHHMATGRLTETYRDRLFYASARSTTRLNAYRNALWGKEGGDVRTNLLKDIGYNVKSLVKEAFSSASVEGPSPSKTIAEMKTRLSFSVAKEALLHFRQIKNHYERVLKLKSRLRESTCSEPPK